jgi:FAD/FMN-containing dehydrogenase/Fe-S oxidoreductase
MPDRVFETIEPATDRRRETGEDGRVHRAYTATEADPARLARDLREATNCEVLFDRGSLAVYSTDASNYRQIPIGVVLPRSVEDVIDAVSVARAHRAPLVMRGGGTSLAGQTCNTALVIDFSRYLDRVLDLDPENRRAYVEPGCILDTLRDAAEEHNLTFGPDPATHTHNTLGGMIGNNSGGVHSVMAGLTVDNVEELDILTYQGERFTVGATSEDELADILGRDDAKARLYRQLVDFRDRYADLIREKFPDIPRRVSGYSNLDWLLPEKGFHVARALVGTEATCVIVLGAKLKLVPSPPERTTVVLGFPTIFDAADAVPRVLEHGTLACEGLDSKLIENLDTKSLHTEKFELLPDGEGWLVVEFGADKKDEADALAQALIDAFEDDEGVDYKRLSSADDQKRLRLLRESGLGATAYVPGEPETWEGWEDTAVPRERLGEYLRAFRKLLDKHGYDTVMYGHFGDGLVHCRINFKLGTEAGLKTLRTFLDEAAELVVGFAGTLSGEHGDGQARAALLEKMYGEELVQGFREFKAIWDPHLRMNPGKVIDPYPILSNLRIGPRFEPPELKTGYAYPDDQGSFARATMRCVGVGKCRRLDPEGEVMCPSFMATRDEKHSTRGRSRLLFEMLREGPIKDGWRSREVEEALDLCFACKACKSDCPVNVDMATYKSEFRSHFYKRRLRPRVAYTMGLIYYWAQLGSRMPHLTNLVLGAPGLSGLAKKVAGVSQDRRLPRFASETFTSWHRRRERPEDVGQRERVILWPDTFSNHFDTNIPMAATRVLERAGYEVIIPSRPLCCGRPLYDWGMLDLAKSQLREIIDTLRPEIEAGTPLIGLEPACTSTFSEELPMLLPDEPLAKRLGKQTVFFSDFLDRNAERFAFLEGDGEALPEAVVQLHCHHHAVIKADAEWRVLERLGVPIRSNPSGCCGMAGSLGFEAQKQEVSLAAGERVLFPALREAPDEAIVLANGFSCREQIRHGSGRRALHVAEIADRKGR